LLKDKVVELKNLNRDVDIVLMNGPG